MQQLQMFLWRLHIIQKRLPYYKWMEKSQQKSLKEGFGLTVMDVSDPYEPVQLGAVDLTQEFVSAVEIAVGGELAYLTSEGAGLWAVDVSDRSAPRALGRFPTDSLVFSNGVDPAEGLVYVTERRLGSTLRVIDFGPEYVPEPGPAARYLAALGALAQLCRRRRCCGSE